MDEILIQCYTGFRPGELCELLYENINLANWSIVGGMKTDAGIERTVPIHPLIREIVSEKYKLSDGKKLFPQLSYQKYKRVFKVVVEDLGLNPEHRPHDPRKQFDLT